MAERMNPDEHRCLYKTFHDNVQKGRRIKRNWRREYLEAKRDAILSGKVVVLTVRDEMTGIIYRYDKAGNVVLLGNGYNRGA